MNKQKSQSLSPGFTLIEVLIALAIFAIGLLGIGLQITKSLNTTINKEVHSAVMQLTLQSIEPLNHAIQTDVDRFKSVLSNLSITEQSPAFNTNNSQFSDFKISVTSATDSLGNEILSTNNANWKPPLTVVLNIEYSKDGSSELSFMSTHVFVPPVEQI